MTELSSTTGRRFAPWLLASAAGIAVATGLTEAAGIHLHYLVEVFFAGQDVPVLYGLSALLTGLAYLDVRGGARAPLPRPTWQTVAALAATSALVAWLGQRFVFGGFALSRDEAMALFDAEILRSGRLVARVAEEWRAFVPALQPVFRLPVEGHLAWVSGYLPGNALLHALLGPLTSPLLAAGSVVLVFAIGRQLWPHRPDVACLAALCLALSPQVVLTSMTPYAAQAHLALNLLWLFCFLRGSPAGHAGAIATGFVATGLHQIAFHPLFVAPFILALWIGRRFRLALIYTLCYALIGLFWIFWMRTMLGAQGLRLSAQGVGTLDTIVRLYEDFAWTGLDVMAKNILRFVGWSFPLLVPLVALGLAGWRKLDQTLRALALGILLTTAVVFILLPYQGHGWGFRYWHGLYGSFALLAAAGYARLPRAPSSVLAAAIASALLLLPLRAWQAHSFAAPYGLANRALMAAPTPLVVVDRLGMYFANDLVRNDPDLATRPRMFDLLELSEDGLRRLCAQGPITLFTAEDGARFGIPLFTGEEPLRAQEQRLLTVMNDLGCAKALAP